jgi:rsbT co-antagonist protein RsbR
MIGYSSNISERKQQEEHLRLFKALIEAAPDSIAAASLETGLTTYANSSFRKLFGYGDSAIGKDFLEVYAETPERMSSIVQEASVHGTWQGELMCRIPGGDPFPAYLSGMVLHNTRGKPTTAAGIIHDMTEQKKAEAEHTSLQEQIIEAQRAALRELSAPLLPISDSVVILPLIGSIDTQRAQQVMETLLEGVAAHRADTAIVDITGVAVVDTQVANALVQAAQAVRLLGARVVLTGIGPAMAQTLVSLGADLSSIVTRGTLQSGIAYAMKP